MTATASESKTDSFASDTRAGIALCLSGGGFRAALFHLGAMRRMHELGLLQRISVVSSVSGGSILAALVVDSLRKQGNPSRLEFADFRKDVVEPFRRVASQDFRTWPVLKNFLWNWLLPGPLLRDIEHRYRDRITTLSLTDLPETPKFVFCATDLTFGVNWEFARDRVGSWQAGYLVPKESQKIPIAHAVAASACFPPLFGPMPVGSIGRELKGGAWRREKGHEDQEKLTQRLSLSDGGVYDNMATEAVWKTAAVVLVSDCGAPFDYEPERPPYRTLLRYVSVTTKQTQALRIRMLKSSWRRGSAAGGPVFGGTRWHLASGKSTAGDGAPLADPVGYLMRSRTPKWRCSRITATAMPTFAFELIVPSCCQRRCLLRASPIPTG